MDPQQRSTGPPLGTDPAEPADPAALEVLATKALTLGVLIDRLEQDDGRHPHLTSAAARLSPDAGATEADRARSAVREVLRPAARELLAEVLRRSGSALPTAPAGATPARAPASGRADDRAPTVSGTVRDAAGRPMGEAVVVLLDPHGTVLASGPTGEDGTYRLTPAPAGPPGAPATVTAYATGFEPAATAAAPGTARLLTLVGRARLSGAVRSAGGAPPPPTRVLVLDGRGIMVARCDTDVDGRFAVGGLGPGTYTVATTSDPPTAAVVRLGPGAAGTVDLTQPSPAGPPHRGPGPQLRPEVP